MEFVKDGVIYNTETSTKIGGPIEGQIPLVFDGFDVSEVSYETLYLSKNKQYYILITRDRLHRQPTDVEVFSKDMAFRWATRNLSVDTVKKHFSDMIREG